MPKIVQHRYSGGDLWVEDPSGSEMRVVCEGRDPVAGRCVSLRNGVAQFDGSKWHGTEAFDGRRLVAVAYTPKHYCHWRDDTRQKLQQLGFPVRRSQSSSMDCSSTTTDIHLHIPAPPQGTTSPQRHPHEQPKIPKEPTPKETSSSEDLKGRSGRDMGLYDSGLVPGDVDYDFGVKCQMASTPPPWLLQGKSWLSWLKGLIWTSWSPITRLDGIKLRMRHHWRSWQRSATLVCTMSHVRNAERDVGQCDLIGG